MKKYDLINQNEVEFQLREINKHLLPNFKTWNEVESLIEKFFENAKSKFLNDLNQKNSRQLRKEEISLKLKETKLVLKLNIIYNDIQINKSLEQLDINSAKQFLTETYNHFINDFIEAKYLEFAQHLFRNEKIFKTFLLDKIKFYKERISIESTEQNERKKPTGEFIFQPKDNFNPFVDLLNQFRKYLDENNTVLNEMEFARRMHKMTIDYGILSNRGKYFKDEKVIKDKIKKLDREKKELFNKGKKNKL